MTTSCTCMFLSPYIRVTCKVSNTNKGILFNTNKRFWNICRLKLKKISMQSYVYACCSVFNYSQMLSQFKSYQSNTVPSFFVHVDTQYDSFAIFIIPFYIFFFLFCALFSANFFSFQLLGFVHNISISSSCWSAQSQVLRSRFALLNVALWSNKTWSLCNFIAEIILLALQNEPKYIR